MSDDKTGIEMLRILTSMASYTTESTFDGLSITDCVSVLMACRELDLEVLPDQLTLKELQHATKSGSLTLACRKRLYKAEGLKPTGRDFE